MQLSESQPQQHSPQDFDGKFKQPRFSLSMEGKRRVVKLLFCDVTSSTKMAGQLDQENWAEIMDGALVFLIHHV